MGLRIAAYYYNRSLAQNAGQLDVVINGKMLNKQQRKCMVWDIERGQSNRIEPEPWQTCTCIGQWHYDRRIYDEGRYKSAKTVIHMLADVVSKNGNLLLSVPLRGDGSLDDKARITVEGIAAWMQIHEEAIIGTKPWHIFGEGPAITEAPELDAQGFNEGKGKAFTFEDIRFTTKGSDVYAIVMGWPKHGEIVIKSMGLAQAAGKRVQEVALLGTAGQVHFDQSDEGLTIQLGAPVQRDDIGVVFKVGYGFA